MNSDLKYVVVSGFLADEIYIFSNHVTHSNMVFNMGIDRESVLGAGFVDADWKCYGKSTSLNVGSRGDGDTVLITRNRG